MAVIRDEYRIACRGPGRARNRHHRELPQVRDLEFDERGTVTLPLFQFADEVQRSLGRRFA